MYYCRVGSSLSSCAELISGVIQGSGIGPLLFLTYINELTKMWEEFGITINFADDSKMYAEITDVTRLQAALGSMPRVRPGVKTVFYVPYCTMPDRFFISTVLVAFLHSPCSYTLSLSSSH